MMKLKVVENEKLKVLTCVRTHPEELLVPKIHLNPKFQKWLWKWSKMTMKMAKNDYENGQKWLWKWLKMTMKTEESQKWSLGLRGVVLTSYDEIESCREWKVESSHMCKNSSRRTPRPKNSSKPKISKMTMKMVKNDYENGQKWLWKWSKMTMKMV